jgi:hypothetical protein
VTGNPALARIRDRHESAENLACAFLDGLLVASELNPLFAVGAAGLNELLLGADDRADHASTHVALLRGRNVSTHVHVRGDLAIGFS